MNKTVNINIGGLFFHIDEDAYQKLSRYFDAIKRSLSNSSGKEEIMKDIEMRVAELLTEKQKSDKHVINLKDVDEVVTIMGQPEDYRIDDEGTETNASNYTSTGRRKLYRDKDNGTFAGVCTGLGHFFGVESVWIKIFFILTVVFGYGFGLVAYFVLWIAMPKAITTTEKLEMTGEPVTISNIEKKVREEFESVSNKIKNVDYDKVGNQIKSVSESASDKIGAIFSSIFGILAKVLGAFIIIFSSFTLLAICIACVFLIFTSSLPDNAVFNHIQTPFDLDTPLWIQGVLFLLAFGIPLFFILLLGLKLLISNMKSIGNIGKYSLLAIWIIAVGVLISLGVNEFSKLAFEGKEIKKETILISPKDTLSIKFKNNDYYTKNVNVYKELWRTQDENNREVIYSNNVSIEIMKTDEATPYFVVEKLAYGKSVNEAKNRAEKIKYNYKVINNQLIFDNYIITEIANKFRKQEVIIYLYLPKDLLFKIDSSAREYDRSDNSFFNLHFSSSDYVYKVGDSQVKCLTCPVSENEYYDVEINDNDTSADSTATLKIENGIIVKKTSTSNDEGKTTVKKEVILNVNGKDIITKETKTTKSN